MTNFSETFVQRAERILGLELVLVGAEEAGRLQAAGIQVYSADGGHYVDRWVALIGRSGVVVPHIMRTDEHYEHIKTLANLSKGASVFNKALAEYVEQVSGMRWRRPK